MTTRISSPKKPGIDYKLDPKNKDRADKWDKSILGKIGSFIGKAQAPMQDVDETVRWIASKGKMKTGGPLGYTRKTLRDLGMGQKTEKKVREFSKPKTEIGDPLVLMRPAIERKLKSKKGEPVGGVGIRRKANDPHGKYVADF